jgi:D-methionine transport system substrate-binding protein
MSPFSRRHAVRAALAFLSVSAAMALGTGDARADQLVRVGIMGGEDEDVWAVAAQEAARRGLTIKLTIFNDYTEPNEALETGDIDANAFQHQPYLDNQIRTRGYHIVPVGYTALWPIGLYSHKVHAVADLRQGALIGVPNDPSNEGRALLLLQSLGVITLTPGADVLATAADVASNAKGFRIKELDAGMVGRTIDDLDAAVVNTDWAFKSKLTNADRIATEPVANNPYRNFIAVKAGRENEPWVKPLVASYQSDAVRAALGKAYGGTAVPAW